MRICNNVYLWIGIIIENMHYCNPDSSPLSTFNSVLCLWTESEVISAQDVAEFQFFSKKICKIPEILWSLQLQSF